MELKLGRTQNATIVKSQIQTRTKLKNLQVTLHIFLWRLIFILFTDANVRTSFIYINVSDILFSFFISETYSIQNKARAHTPFSSFFKFYRIFYYIAPNHTTLLSFYFTPFNQKSSIYHVWYVSHFLSFFVLCCIMLQLNA